MPPAFCNAAPATKLVSVGHVEVDALHVDDERPVTRHESTPGAPRFAQHYGRQRAGVIRAIGRGVVAVDNFASRRGFVTVFLRRRADLYDHPAACEHKARRQSRPSTGETSNSDLEEADQLSQALCVRQAARLAIHATKAPHMPRTNRAAMRDSASSREPGTATTTSLSPWSMACTNRCLRLR